LQFLANSFIFVMASVRYYKQKVLIFGIKTHTLLKLPHEVLKVHAIYTVKYKSTYNIHNY
jgi:hypothetical protein